MSAFYYVFCLLLLAEAVTCFGTGGPQKVCGNLFPGHGVESQPRSSSPFNISVSPESYSPGDVLNVTLSGSGGKMFRGFMMGAHRAEGDTEEMVGNFINYENIGNGRNWYPQESTYTNCITHVNSNDKDSIVLQWQAPSAVSLGDIFFMATFVEEYTIIYADMESDVVKGNEPAPSSNWPQIDSAFEDIDFGGCGVEKGCMSSSSCDVSKCDYFVSWKMHGENATFEVKAKTEGYVAIGVSRDNKMPDMETVMCAVTEEYAVIEHGYNMPDDYRRNYRHRMSGFSLLSAKREDGYVYCRWTRPVNTTIQDLSGGDSPAEFSLDEDLYLVIAHGHLHAEIPIVYKHDELPIISGSKIAFSSHTVEGGATMPLSTRLHASLMIISWMFFAGLGVVLARYYKEAFRGKAIQGIKLWFQMHRLCALFIFVLTTVSFIYIFVEVGGWSDSAGTYHAPMGIAVVSMMLIQMLAGMLRPGLTSPKRLYFNWAHRFNGFSLHILAAATMFMGVNLSTISSRVSSELTLLLIVWVVAQVVIEILFEIHKCTSGRSSVEDVVDKAGMSSVNGDESVKNTICLDAAFVIYILTLLTITVTAVVIINTSH